MDIGLYNLKYPVRRLLAGLLPAFKDVDPNSLSWLMLPVGLLIAAAYGAGANGWPGLFVVGALLIFGRMFLGTMDGLLATHYGKSTPQGEIINRLAPELCDVMYFVALALARPDWRVPAILALAAAWLVTFTGLVGATTGLPTQSVGPAGQTDRLATLQVLSLLAFIGAKVGSSFDFIGLFLWWVAVGGALTSFLRLKRHFGALAAAAAKPS